MNFKILSRILLMLPSLLCALDSVAPAAIPVPIKDRNRMYASTSRSRAKKCEKDLEDVVKSKDLWPQFLQEFEARKVTIGAKSFYRDDEIAMLARNDLDPYERQKIWARTAQEAARHRKKFKLQLLWELAGKPPKLEPYPNPAQRWRLLLQEIHSRRASMIPRATSENAA